MPPNRRRSQNKSPEFRQAEAEEMDYGHNSSADMDPFHVSDDVDYTTSHVVIDKQSNNLGTQAALDVSFPPVSVATVGLERPTTPPSPELPRYYRLMEQCIDPLVIVPLNPLHIEKACRLVPESQRNWYHKEVNKLREVCWLFY